MYLYACIGKQIYQYLRYMNPSLFTMLTRYILFKKVGGTEFAFDTTWDWRAI